MNPPQPETDLPRGHRHHTVHLHLDPRHHHHVPIHLCHHHHHGAHPPAPAPPGHVHHHAPPAPVSFPIAHSAAAPWQLEQPHAAVGEETGDQEAEPAPHPDEAEEEPLFVLTDEWAEFFAKSEAKRRLAKQQRKNKGRK